LKLIVGLGNPGNDYVNTRHNVGFIVLEKFANDKNLVFEKDNNLYYCAFKKSNNQYALLKPLTYMNLSGRAIKHFAQIHKISHDDILVVYDDLALPFLTYKLKPKGGDGGHNGIKSIIQELGNSSFPRLRIGIGNNFQKGEMADYVLDKFNNDELSQLELLYNNQLKSIIDNFLHRGIKGALDFVSKLNNNPALEKRD